MLCLVGFDCWISRRIGSAKDAKDAKKGIELGCLDGEARWMAGGSTKLSAEDAEEI